MDKILKLSALNIVLHPHSKDGYKSLIIDAFNVKRSIKMKSGYFGLPVPIEQVNIEDDYIVGKFYRYMEIDINKP
jgi:hypothetical protein